MNRLTIPFELCLPTPTEGYFVYYRPVGSIEVYRVAGPFTSSPIIVNDSEEDVLTQFQGYIQSDCGDGILGNQIPFQTVAPPILCRTYDVTVGSTDGPILISWIDCGGTPLDELREPETTFRVCAKEDTVVSGSPGSTSIVFVGNGCIPPDPDPEPTSCNTWLNPTFESIFVSYLDCPGGAQEGFIPPGVSFCAREILSGGGGLIIVGDCTPEA